MLLTLFTSLSFVCRTNNENNNRKKSFKKNCELIHAIERERERERLVLGSYRNFLFLYLLGRLKNSYYNHFGKKYLFFILVNNYS